jgi:1-deoxy-D-xylulose 5-phosphate reductoisomerase
LQNRIRFTQIHDVIDKTLQSIESGPVTDLETILHADRIAREFAGQMVTA